MTDALHTLTQAELLALALEASRRDDTGHAMAYLKEAAARDDASAEALFMLGSEYAQIGLIAEAQQAMARSLERPGALPIARFQLGLLQLTSGDPLSAQTTWMPLAQLPDSHPQAYLKTFQRGMNELIADAFDAALASLRAGIAANQENAALNADMAKVIDAILHLPGRDAEAPDAEPLQARATEADAPTQAAEAASAPADAELEPSHLFISAYTHRGKPH